MSDPFRRPVQRRNYVPGQYATYAPQVPYRIDARAPLSAVDQRALDTGTHASVPFTPRGERQGVQSAQRAKPLDVNSGAVQTLLDNAAGAPSTGRVDPTNPGAVARATGQQQQTKYGTVGTTSPAAKPDGTVIKDAAGNDIGIAGNVQQGPPAPTLDQTRAATLAKHPEIGIAGSPENLAFTNYAKSINPTTGQPYGEAGAHANLGTIMQQFQVGPAAPTPSDQARMDYTQSKMQPGLMPGAPKPGKAIAEAARRDAAIAAGNNTTPSLEDSLTSWGAMKEGLRDLVGGTRPGSASAIAARSTPPPVTSPVSNPAGNSGDGEDTVPNLSQKPFVPSIARPAATPPQTPGLDRQAQMQADKSAGKSLDTASDMPGLDAMKAAGPKTASADSQSGSAPSDPAPEEREDGVPNLASGFNPSGDTQFSYFTPSLSRAQQVDDASLKSNMEAGQLAARNNDIAAGFPDQHIATQRLAGPNGPVASVPGYNPDDNKWSDVPNYAAGRLPSHAKRKLFTPAMARERAAIKHGVGGARPGDKPVPTVIPGVGPAVVNTGERILPTPQGAAVVNRNQQKKLFTPPRGPALFVPKRSPVTVQ